jgi:hypothetical protein
VRPILKIDGHLDDVEAHSDHVAAGRAVISGTTVAFEGVVEIAAVEEMVSQVVVTTANTFLREK